MERILPPQDLLDAVDFSLDTVCERCPLRRPELEGFEPAYGVIVNSDEAATNVDIINFEAEWNLLRNNGSVLQQAAQAVDLSIGNIASPVIEEAFLNCQSPVLLPRRFRSDEIVCSALNRILTDIVPTRKNLKIHDIAKV